jgi:hypothetical protein
LQPFSHIGKKILQSDPTLECGLASSYQAYGYVKRLQKFSGDRKTQSAILQADFESATDFICHKTGRVVGEAFFEGFPYSEYNISCIRLLCSPRIIEDYQGIITSKGVLMGEPGSKVILTLIGKCINIRSRGLDDQNMVRTWRQLAADPFSTAGDDIIDQAEDKRVLEAYMPVTRFFRMAPSLSKWAIRQKAVRYCTQMILCNEPFNSALLDTIRMRLLSRHSKVGAGKGDEDTNPVWGRAKLLYKESEWLQDTLLKQNATRLFIHNMGELLEVDYKLYMPDWLGGLNLGVDPDTVWPLLPGWHKRALAMVYDRQPNMVRVLMDFGNRTLTTRGKTLIETGDGSSKITDLMVLLEEALFSRSLSEALGTCDYKTATRMTHYFNLRVVGNAGWKSSSAIATAIANGMFWSEYLAGQKPLTLDRGFKNRSWSTRNRDTKLQASALGADTYREINSEEFNSLMFSNRIEYTRELRLIPPNSGLVWLEGERMRMAAVSDFVSTPRQGIQFPESLQSQADSSAGLSPNRLN